MSNSGKIDGAGGVAHRLEQAAHNHLVVGSIPTAPTKINLTIEEPQEAPLFIYVYV